ncbi:MAG: hypothetical protein GXY58_11915 [Planctomycetaceae bacterium]|nr:hypothetical protein [Planctomycetaceae bacterium]
MSAALLVPVASQLLLAQAAAVDDTPWKPLTQWSDIPLGLLTKIAAALLIAAVVAWIVTRIRRHRERVNYNSPRGLFNDLCALHDLDWPTRKLLRQLARLQHHDHPARIFLDPAAFEPANIPPPLQPFQAELRRLKTRLF